MKLVSVDEVASTLKMAKSTLYANMRKDPSFPQRIHVGGRAYWDNERVKAWLQAKFDAAEGAATERKAA